MKEGNGRLENYSKNMFNNEKELLAYTIGASIPLIILVLYMLLK